MGPTPPGTGVIMLATAAYEAYNTVLTIFMPEYRTAAFIGHHAVTCFLGVLPGAHIRPPP